MSNELIKYKYLFDVYISEMRATIEIPSHPGRPKIKDRTVGNLSEIRRSFVWHLNKSTDLSLKQIATIIGVSNHSSVLYLRETAREYINAEDPVFLKYYSILLTCINLKHG